MTAPNTGFVRDHHRHRVQDLLYHHYYLIMHTFVPGPNLMCFSTLLLLLLELCREPLRTLLRPALVVAFVIFLTSLSLHFSLIGASVTRIQQQWPAFPILHEASFQISSYYLSHTPLVAASFSPSLSSSCPLSRATFSCTSYFWTRNEGPRTGSRQDTTALLS